MTDTKPYGRWVSKLTPDIMAQASGRLNEVRSNNNAIYWMAQLPQDKGRQVIFRWDGKDKPECVTPDDVNVGNRINEYGGGSFTFYQNTLLYGDKKTNAWFKGSDGAFTNDASFLGDPAPSNNQMICVRENEAGQQLVRVSLKNGEVKIIDDEHDFYAHPRLSETDKHLAYICWDLPHMPWENSQLMVDDNLVDLPGFQSQPTWLDEDLYFLSDHTGFGQLYHYQGLREVKPVCDNWPAHFDAAMPLWNLGMQTFLPLGEDKFAIIFSDEGIYRLGIIDAGKLNVLDLPFTAYGDHLALWEGKLAFNAATPTEPFAIRVLDLSSLKFETLSDEPAVLYNKDISVAKPITFNTQDGHQAHAFYYPPCNSQYQAPKNTLPPLLVMSHGGPTSYTHCAYNNKIQFWTSRGFAVVDVNYRGSTGYGRAYWEALKHRWGETDVMDCVDAAQYLIDEGLVDENKLFIRGSSAGGFLSLCALAATDKFTSAAIYYGISDLSAFMEHTHRFEAGYNDWLLGNVKSPINMVEQFNSPIIFFHGLKDNVVPAIQSEVLFHALQARGIETAFHTYPEEGHGFRQAQTVVDTLEKELDFYLRS